MNKVERQDGDTEPRTIAAIAAEVVDGYRTGIAGDAMGFVSAAFDCGWMLGAQQRAAEPERPAPSYRQVGFMVTCKGEPAVPPEFFGMTSPRTHYFHTPVTVPIYVEAPLAASAPVVDNGANLGHSTESADRAVQRQDGSVEVGQRVWVPGIVEDVYDSGRVGAPRPRVSVTVSKFSTIVYDAAEVRAASPTVDDNAAVHREEAPTGSTERSPAFLDWWHDHGRKICITPECAEFVFEAGRAARQVDAPLTDEQIDAIKFGNYVHRTPEFNAQLRAFVRAALAAAPPRPPDDGGCLACVMCGAPVDQAARCGEAVQRQDGDTEESA